MSDFFARLAARTLETIPVVQPLVAPRFAQGQELVSELQEEWNWGEPPEPNIQRQQSALPQWTEANANQEDRSQRTEGQSTQPVQASNPNVENQTTTPESQPTNELRGQDTTPFLEAANSPKADSQESSHPEFSEASLLDVEAHEQQIQQDTASAPIESPVEENQTQSSTTSYGDLTSPSDDKDDYARSNDTSPIRVQSNQSIDTPPTERETVANSQGNEQAHLNEETEIVSRESQASKDNTETVNPQIADAPTQSNPRTSIPSTNRPTASQRQPIQRLTSPNEGSEVTRGSNLLEQPNTSQTPQIIEGENVAAAQETDQEKNIPSAELQSQETRQLNAEDQPSSPPSREAQASPTPRINDALQDSEAHHQILGAEEQEQSQSVLTRSESDIDTPSAPSTNAEAEAIRNTSDSARVSEDGERLEASDNVPPPDVTQVEPQLSVQERFAPQNEPTHSSDLDTESIQQDTTLKNTSDGESIGPQQSSSRPDSENPHASPTSPADEGDRTALPANAQMPIQRFVTPHEGASQSVNLPAHADSQEQPSEEIPTIQVSRSSSSDDSEVGQTSTESPLQETQNEGQGQAQEVQASQQDEPRQIVEENTTPSEESVPQAIEPPHVRPSTVIHMESLSHEAANRPNSLNFPDTEDEPTAQPIEVNQPTRDSGNPNQRAGNFADGERPPHTLDSPHYELAQHDDNNTENDAQSTSRSMLPPNEDSMRVQDGESVERFRTSLTSPSETGRPNEIVLPKLEGPATANVVNREPQDVPANQQYDMSTPSQPEYRMDAEPSESVDDAASTALGKSTQPQLIQSFQDTHEQSALERINQPNPQPVNQSEAEDATNSESGQVQSQVSSQIGSLSNPLPETIQSSSTAPQAQQFTGRTALGSESSERPQDSPPVSERRLTAGEYGNIQNPQYWQSGQHGDTTALGAARELSQEVQSATEDNQEITSSRITPTTGQETVSESRHRQSRNIQRRSHVPGRDAQISGDNAIPHEMQEQTSSSEPSYKQDGPIQQSQPRRPVIQRTADANNRTASDLPASPVSSTTQERDASDLGSSLPENSSPNYPNRHHREIDSYRNVSQPRLRQEPEAALTNSRPNDSTPSIDMSLKGSKQTPSSTRESGGNSVQRPAMGQQTHTGSNTDRLSSTQSAPQRYQTNRISQDENISRTFRRNNTAQPQREQPTTQIRIGRIEIRGESQASLPPQPSPPPRRKPAMSLDDYIKKRSGRA